MAHAKRSPSSAHRWSICTRSVEEEANLPDNGSAAAAWGTAAHLVSSNCLESFGLQVPGEFLGQFVVNGDAFGPGPDGIEITDEMVDCCNTYVGYVQNLVEQTSGVLHIEVRVPIDHITGETDAGGTSDAVVLTDDEIHIIDLKGGQGRVDAYDAGDLLGRTPNHQLAMYADGAMRALGKRKTVHLHIVQPRLKHLSVHTLSSDDLLTFTDVIRKSVAAEPVYAPDPDRCKFCRANGDCKGQRDAILEGFTDNGVMKPVTDDALGSFYDLVPLLEKTLKAVEAKVRAKLEAGQNVIGKDGAYKLVEGRMGSRAWSNLEEVEAVVKNKHIKQAVAYNIVLKSPAQLEEALAKEQPRNWKQIAEFISQTRNKPRIAKATDPAPAIDPLAGFENVDAGTP